MQTKKLMEFAIAQHLKGDLATANEVYKKVLQFEPDFADAWNLTGVISYQRGDHDEGIKQIARAISLRDDVPGYYLNLATALMASKRAKEAEVCCRQCLDLDPNHKLAWNVLGNALHELDSVEEAIRCFERAIELDENHVDAWVNLGRLYRETHQLAKAEECTNRALKIDATHPVALNNLGAILHSQDRDEEALVVFETALQREPDSSKILVNMGNTLQDLGRFTDAEVAFSKAVESQPDNANAWNSLGFFYTQLAQSVSAMDCYRRAIDLDPYHHSAPSNYLFGLNFADVTRADCFAEHVAMADFFPEQEGSPDINADVPDRKLRIGYVSPDFRQHPLVSFFEPILENHSSEQFDIYCYANVMKPDAVTDRLKGKATQWRSTFGKSDDDVLATIAEDQIDILIDLAGHTANNRLSVFAQRAAAVQISMLGYLNTTGLQTMDYFVSDELRDPASEDEFYTEEVIRLEGGGCCWAAPIDAPDVKPPPGLERGYVTFGSMHRPNKLTDDTLRMWTEILNSVPDSRLLLFHNAFKKSEELQAHQLHRFNEVGLSPDRIDLAWDDANEYLIAYEEMDILLEAIPWSSGTTALEALYQGVPIPTINGSTPCGRATVSALGRLGFSELVANDQKDYIGTVVELANDTERLTQIRDELRPRMQRTLCDARAFVFELESSYRQMWQRVCDAA
jgi:predicted O-linked N-acetylglucosamine transferase (SPINDLY family)